MVRRKAQRTVEVHDIRRTIARDYERGAIAGECVDVDRIGLASRDDGKSFWRVNESGHFTERGTHDCLAAAGVADGNRFAAALVNKLHDVTDDGRIDRFDPAVLDWAITADLDAAGAGADIMERGSSERSTGQRECISAHGMRSTVVNDAAAKIAQ